MIWHLHTDYSKLQPVNFDVSTINCLGSWRAERCWLQSPPLSFYISRSRGDDTVLTSVSSTTLLLSCYSMFIYPHQGLASFHPTSKDSLCGAHGRRNGTMHLCHIYHKIKQWIHDKSNKLIKTVHMCGRWTMEWNTPFMNLSLLYLDNKRSWLYRYLFISSFFMDIDVSIFFLFIGSCFLGMPSFLSLFWIAHASFEGY